MLYQNSGPVSSSRISSILRSILIRPGSATSVMLPRFVPDSFAEAERKEKMRLVRILFEQA